MKRFFSVCVLLFALTACPSPPDASLLNDARTAANDATVLAIETAQTSAELLYREHQLIVLNAEAAREGATQESVKAAVGKVRARWAPVRRMFDHVHAMHEELVDLLESGADPDRIVDAYALLSAKQREIANEISLLRSEVSW